MSASTEQLVLSSYTSNETIVELGGSGLSAPMICFCSGEDSACSPLQKRYKHVNLVGVCQGKEGEAPITSTLFPVVGLYD